MISVNFRVKIRKLSYMFFGPNQIIKDFLTFKIIKFASLKLLFWSHFLDRAKRVKISARQVFANRIFGIKIYWYIFEDSVFITVSICLELRLWSFWPGYWWSFRHGVRGRWTFDCEAPGPPSSETVPLCIVPIYPVPICPYRLPLLERLLSKFPSDFFHRWPGSRLP